jgi:hypothetical protein
MTPYTPRFRHEPDRIAVGYFPTDPPDPPPPPPTLHCVGLDLGQAADHSALAVLQYEDTEEPTYYLDHLARWPLATAYRRVVADVTALVHEPPLGWHPPLWPPPVAGWRVPALGLDRTGVGAGVLELFDPATLAADMHPVLITGGHAVSRGPDGTWHVSKCELVGALMGVFHGGRLRINSAMDLAGTLVTELRNFKMKLTPAANLTFESWRESIHDDLVLAVAIAVWLAEHRPRGVLDAWV